MAEFDSQWKDTRHIKLTVWESDVQHNNNRSKVNWKIEVLGNYYGSTWISSKVYLKINGSEQCDYTTWIDPPNSSFPMGQGTSKSGSLWVDHETNGTKTVNIQYDVAILSAASESHGGTFKLTNIDRDPPSVSVSASAASTTSITLSGSSGTTTCNSWDYKIDSGSWTNYSTTEGTSSGNKTVTGLTSASHTVQVRATKKLNGLTGTSSSTTVDLVAPTVDVSLSNITVSGVTISASTGTVNCNAWDYSMDSGTTWTSFSTTDGTSATVTITGLTVNTSYSIIVRAKKTSNGLFGMSEASSFSTLGNTRLNSAVPYYPDSSSLTITFNWTVYVASYYHKLEIKDGLNNTIMTFHGLRGNAGTESVTLTISNVQKNVLLNLIPITSKTYSLTMYLSTYDSYENAVYGNQIGSYSICMFSIGTTAADSGPTMQCSVIDTNPRTTALTGDPSKLILNASSASCNMNISTRNGATIQTATINGMQTTSYVFNNVNIPSFTFIVRDSRGYEVTNTISPTIINYVLPTCVLSAERIVPVSGNKVALTFSGRYFNGSFSTSQQNTLTITYQYKETSASTYSAAIAVNPSDITTTSTSYASDGSIESSAVFDYTKSYDIKVTVTDRIYGAVQTYTISKGVPIFDWGNNDFQFNVETFILNVDHTISDAEYKNIATYLALPFSSTSTYLIGEFATNSGHVYECKTAISTAGAWDSSKWTDLGAI